MPTLLQIFGNSVTSADNEIIIVRDRKPKQCTFISNSDEYPYVKRCTKNKAFHQKVCKDHADG